METTVTIERETLAEQVNALRPAIARLCRAVLGGTTHAEAATQEACLRALQGLGSYDPARPLRPWVLRIARNTAIDEMRRRGDRSLADVEPLTDDTPVTRLIEGERADQIAAAMHHLGPALREVLLLKYIEELPNQTIAELLGITRAALWMRLSRARAELRRRCHADLS